MIAFLFPGQGSQIIGMGKDIAKEFKVSKDVFDEVDDTLGFSLSDLIWQGDQETLNLTKNIGVCGDACNISRKLNIKWSPYIDQFRAFLMLCLRGIVCYLWSEGIIQSPHDILEVAHCQRGSGLDNNILNVFLRQDIDLEDHQFHRFSYAASGCGLCGKSTIESIHTKFPAVQSEVRLSVRVMNGLLDTVKKCQPLFEKTGGLHAAALFTIKGELVEILEDVGRHNAVDKVIGSRVRKGHSKLEDHLLFVTSRASFEIVQKALSAQIPAIACASAPSSLAVEFAKANQQTLIGFMRSGRFNVYSRHDRLVTG